MARPRSDRELHSINLKLDKLDYEWLKAIYGDQYVSGAIREIIRQHRARVETAARAREQRETINGER